MCYEECKTIEGRELLIINHLLANGKKTRAQLVKELGIHPRVINVSLRRMRKYRLIKTIPNLLDMRKSYYGVESHN